MSAFDLVEAYQLGHAVSTLHDLNILASLGRPLTAGALARRYQLDRGLLRGTLEYVAARTNLVRKTGGRFVATRSYSAASRFLVDLYAGAYGGNAVTLGTLMRRPSLAVATVDRARHARAFQAVGGLAPSAVAEVVQQLGLTHVLDIGCGPAALLLRLAAGDPAFVGWGLEANPAMCRMARGGIRAARMGRRLRILDGDSRHLRATLPADVRSRVEAVVASQVANEMFGTGTARVVSWLRGIRRTLPGRPLLVADYYGRLGHAHTKRGEHQRETLLHDYAQVISGQGVPPVNLAAWRAIYAAAGCRLAHVLEDTSTTRFIHIVML